MLYFTIIMSMAMISATSNQCSMSVSLINQDPYPANPGDYVKLVFQIDGIANPECGTVTFGLKDKFPIGFDPGMNSSVSVKAGVYQYDYGSFLTVPFKVRVSEDAIDGDNPIETSLAYEGVKEILDNFTLAIKNMMADFDVHVKNYDLTTNMMTIEILNLGKTSVSAIEITIPPQNNIVIKGSNKNIVGDLDSNEYTTADFEVSGGGQINLEISYSDGINIRRQVNKTILFDPLYFENRKAQQKTIPTFVYFIVVIVIIILVFWIYRRYRKLKHKKLFS